MQDMIPIIFLVLFFFFLIWLFGYLGRSGRWRPPNKRLTAKDRSVLNSKVRFYKDLNPEEKKFFEFKAEEFLSNVKVTGVGTKVNRNDELLIAASAVIPIFRFPEWQYLNLNEVLLYESSFDEDFRTGTDGSHGFTGMVGDGFLNGKMILSKPDLHWGFSNEWDGSNVGIHEFVHLIDNADGSTDGIPELFLQKQYMVPWVELMRRNIEMIMKGRSDINPYGATDRTEFFAVVSEYFFNNPGKLKANHPELYELLEKIFRIRSRFYR